MDLEYIEAERLRGSLLKLVRGYRFDFRAHCAGNEVVVIDTREVAYATWKHD